MLSTRSARLAALLLLTLALGWNIRASRRGPASPLPPPTSAVKPPADAAPKSAFPDE